MDYPIIYGRIDGGARAGAYGTYFDYVKQYRMEHPSLTWMEAVKAARGPYREAKGEGLVGGAIPPPNISSMTGLSPEIAKAAVMDAIEEQGGYGTSRGAVKGWVTRYRDMGEMSKARREAAMLKDIKKSKKKKKKGGARGFYGHKKQHEIDSLEGWEKRHKKMGQAKKAKKEAKQIRMLRGEGAYGFYGHPKQHELDALKGWEMRYQDMGEPAKAHKEMQKIKSLKSGKRAGKRGFYGHHLEHEVDSLEGWEKRHKKKGQTKKAAKEAAELRSLIKSHKTLNKMIEGGLLAGKQKKLAKRRRAAIEGWITRYENEGKCSKASSEKRKLYKME